MKKGFSVLNSNGFTLVELILVMLLMSLIASVAIAKIESLSDSTEDKALEKAVIDLNAREALTWNKIKLSDSGWINDDETFAQVDTNFNSEHIWTTGPTASDGTLQFRSKSRLLVRTPSTNKSQGYWK